MGKSKRDLQNRKKYVKKVASISEQGERKTKNGAIREVGFKDSQLSILNRTFGLKQHLSTTEVENLAREIRLSQKQVRTWFANKRKRCKGGIGKSTAFSKIAKVAVLMDMDTINAMKESILMHSNKDKSSCDYSDDDASDDSMSLSEKTSVLERREMVNVNVKQARFWMMEKDKSNGEKETPAPLMKQCTSTNKYLENFLQRIEDLEEGLKEREGQLYFTKKELASCKENLENKERVLQTIQQSIPRVVSDHKKNLEMKDTEILEMKNKFDSSENKNKELSAELESLKNEGRYLKGKLTENSPRNPFVSETGNPSEEQKVKMKSKENQVLLLESMLAATRSQLAECKDQNAELQRKEFENVEKISVLQFELHSKSAELGTMGLVIRRLNEKIKSLNQRTQQNTEEQLNLVGDLDSPREKRMRIEKEENGSEGMMVVETLLSDIISVL